MPGLLHGCLGVAANIFEPISKLCRPFDVPGGLGWVISTVETARRFQGFTKPAALTQQQGFRRRRRLIGSARDAHTCLANRRHPRVILAA